MAIIAEASTYPLIVRITMIIFFSIGRDLSRCPCCCRGRRRRGCLWRSTGTQRRVRNKGASCSPGWRRWGSPGWTRIATPHSGTLEDFLIKAGVVHERYSPPGRHHRTHSLVAPSAAVALAQRSNVGCVGSCRHVVGMDRYVEQPAVVGNER